MEPWAAAKKALCNVAVPQALVLVPSQWPLAPLADRCDTWGSGHWLGTKTVAGGTATLA